ncbi:hypothetical protein HOY80DRAFT_1061625 [Tuber brumale]|nr:hypothetical protein HOY80DRAFT_1061625 [Tuber brumale]
MADACLIDSSALLINQSDFINTFKAQTRIAIKNLNPELLKAELDTRFQDYLRDKDAEELLNTELIVLDTISMVKEYINLDLLTHSIDDMDIIYLDAKGEDESSETLPIILLYSEVILSLH